VAVDVAVAEEVDVDDDVAVAVDVDVLLRGTQLKGSCPGLPWWQPNSPFSG
jgi:hypothetical protein